MVKATSDKKSLIDTGVQSVSQRIMQGFIDQLAAMSEYEDVAARLKIELIDNGSTSELALRRALFGEEDNDKS